MLGKRMSVGRDGDPVMKPCVKKDFAWCLAPSGDLAPGLRVFLR